MLIFLPPPSNKHLKHIGDTQCWQGRGAAATFQATGRVPAADPLRRAAAGSGNVEPVYALL